LINKYNKLNERISFLDIVIQDMIDSINYYNKLNKQNNLLLKYKNNLHNNINNFINSNLLYKINQIENQQYIEYTYFYENY